MKFNHCIVIGAGTMGRGIAQWFLQQGLVVELIDQNVEFCHQSVQAIVDSLKSLTDKKKISSDEFNTYSKNLSVKTLANLSTESDLVIEAIIEDKEIKKSLFLELDKKMSSKTIIASNTSSFPIAELSNHLSPARKKIFLGLHFFNPATIMKLVEVISIEENDPQFIKDIVTFFNEHKKIACHCTDAPGFIVNRVARNFYGESLRSLGTLSESRVKEIDLVMREVGGFKMGPFELMDLIGIDVNFSVTESVYKAFFDEARFKPHRIQRDLVLAGRLGKKTKRGFYRYDS